MVSAAVGEDLQTYAQRRLFAPLGIPRRDWTWARDRSGTTQGFAFLSMAPRSLGRFGQLLLQDGRRADRQLIAPDYVHQMSQPTATNPAYGFLVWTNAGTSMVTATMPSRRILDQRFLPPAPADTYAFVGFLGQLIIVIPSLDMVVVRTGLPGNRDPDAHSLLTVKAGDMDYEGIRGLMQAVTDVQVPDPGPYVSVSRFDPLDVNRFFDLQTMLSALAT